MATSLSAVTGSTSSPSDSAASNPEEKTVTVLINSDSEKTYYLKGVNPINPVHAAASMALIEFFITHGKIPDMHTLKKGRTSVTVDGHKINCIVETFDAEMGTHREMVTFFEGSDMTKPVTLNCLCSATAEGMGHLLLHNQSLVKLKTSSLVPTSFMYEQYEPKKETESGHPVTGLSKRFILTKGMEDNLFETILLQNDLSTPSSQDEKNLCEALISRLDTKTTIKLIMQFADGLQKLLQAGYDLSMISISDLSIDQISATAYLKEWQKLMPVATSSESEASVAVEPFYSVECEKNLLLLLMNIIVCFSGKCAKRLKSDIKKMSSSESHKPISESKLKAAVKSYLKGLYYDWKKTTETSSQTVLDDITVISPCFTPIENMLILVLYMAPNKKRAQPSLSTVVRHLERIKEQWQSQSRLSLNECTQDSGL
ncbi:hypothetical protein D5018_12265 [Parashewanella curva]|uniref:Uncharacterized protein n=1 Tax=Parashewanella curva TaxID=2338552 RepID=A0A3L8PVL1_9GAMM|nr:hypothetical protein [Parashewanella curva]RLV59400.1 hypothetical protein D5018_12265 [Parashewanella curva]